MTLIPEPGDQPQFDRDGLVTAVVQDSSTGRVLMVAHMDEQAWEATLRTREVHFFSRSRKALWRKGETSGNTMQVEAIRIDCDRDAIVLQVKAAGPACHTGEATCFFRTVAGSRSEEALASNESAGPDAVPPVDIHVISQLVEVIKQRHRERPEGRYTTYLFEQGLDKILKKIGEEATEVVIAAKNEIPEAIAQETADLIYHLLVMLEQSKVDLSQVIRVLEDRRGGAVIRSLGNRI